jgi:hypothetical protein
MVIKAAGDEPAARRTAYQAKIMAPLVKHRMAIKCNFLG